MTDVLADIVLAGLDAFVADLNRGLDALAVDRGLLVEMDHVCYRVATAARYEELVAALRHETELLGQHAIGGRLITTFRLAEPVVTGGWRISYLELPAPKAGSPTPKAWSTPNWSCSAATSSGSVRGTPIWSSTSRWQGWPRH